MSRVDMLIFGCTGFTGRKAVEELSRIAQRYNITWAIGGRSEDKMKAILEEISNRTGNDLSNVQVIKADVNESDGLRWMCSQTRVLLNCCGPFRLYGEPVIKACLDAKTHYMDVSGEPQFMENMQRLYDSKAKKSGVYIISACGFDCIPNDVGLVHLKQHFNGTLNSVESYLSTEIPSKYKRFGECLIHYGTWESLVLSLANWSELKELRNRLYPTPLPKFKPKLEQRSIVHKNDGKWCIPFPGADASSVYRSQRYTYEREGVRPTQFRAYIALDTIFEAIILLFMSGIIYILAQYSLTRGLLLRHPKIFTLGVVSHQGPKEELMNSNTFTFKINGKGWNEDVADFVKNPPNKKMTLKVEGVNPGYGATVTALVFSALTALREADVMPDNGGVISPGAAFSKTSLVQKLNDNNLTFQLLSNDHN